MPHVTSQVLATDSPRGLTLEWLPVLAGLLLLCVPTLYYLATTYWGEDEYSHGPLILGVIVWLVWDKRQVLLARPARTNPIPGLSLLILGLLLYVAGRSQEIIVLEVGAFAPVLAGVILAMRGWAGFRAMWLVPVLIAYLVPPPGVLLDAVTGPLKRGASMIAGHILYTAGYPIANSGVILNIGPYQLLVADACAGFNSMFSLSALGLLYLYLMRHESWMRNGVILASLLPIAFCANVARVMILVLTTYHFGDAAGQGFVHGFSGVFLFVITLVFIYFLDGMLGKLFKPQVQAR